MLLKPFVYTHYELLDDALSSIKASFLEFYGNK